MKLSLPSPIKSKEHFWYFAYYSGCGNFFLIAFDPENLHEKMTQEERAALVCIPEKVVDGLLFLGIANDSLCMHYYNSDGSRASMCGNGLRSLSHFASHVIQGLPSFFTINTDVGKRTIHMLSDNEIETDMGPMKVPKVIGIEKETLYLTDTGVPHAILVHPTLPQGPIEQEARHYRFHEALGKEGANISYASFSQKKNGTVVHLRTYERGVERETGACGTGACAAAGILYHHFGCPFPFTICFASKEQAQVSLQADRLMLRASCEYKGSYFLPNPLV